MSYLVSAQGRDGKYNDGIQRPEVISTLMLARSHITTQYNSEIASTPIHPDGVTISATSQLHAWKLVLDVGVEVGAL
jgi:hypothetical protein